jgi:hypothetical protein
LDRRVTVGEIDRDDLEEKAAAHPVLSADD